MNFSIVDSPFRNIASSFRIVNTFTIAGRGRISGTGEVNENK